MSRNGARNEGGAGADSGSGIPPGALGGWLRTQREARGVSLRDIADASKISLRHLQALEADRFDTLPAPVFVRGFLREYARVVGLDPDEVVNVYIQASAAEAAEDSSAEIPRARSTPMSPSPIGYGLLVAAIIVVLLALAAAVSYWVGRRSGSGNPDIGAAAVESARTAPPAAAAATRSTAERGSLPESAAQAAPGAEPPGPPTSAPVAETPPAASAPALGRPAAGSVGAEATVQPIHLVLEFLQDCWVEVIVDGNRRPSELKAGGEVMALDARDSIVLTLGNAPAVRAELDGHPFTLPSDGSKVLHELRIDRSTLATPGAAPSAPR